MKNLQQIKKQMMKLIRNKRNKTLLVLKLLLSQLKVKEQRLLLEDHA